MAKCMQLSVLDGCKEISMSENHYYIVLMKTRGQSLQKKILSQGLNNEEVMNLFNALKQLFQEMKKLKTYHG